MKVRGAVDGSRFRALSLQPRAGLLWCSEHWFLLPGFGHFVTPSHPDTFF